MASPIAVEQNPFAALASLSVPQGARPPSPVAENPFQALQQLAAESRGAVSTNPFGELKKIVTIDGDQFYQDGERQLPSLLSVLEDKLKGVQTRLKELFRKGVLKRIATGPVGAIVAGGVEMFFLRHVLQLEPSIANQIMFTQLLASPLAAVTAKGLELVSTRHEKFQKAAGRIARLASYSTFMAMGGIIEGNIVEPAANAFFHSFDHKEAPAPAATSTPESPTRPPATATPHHTETPSATSTPHHPEPTPTASPTTIAPDGGDTGAGGDGGGGGGVGATGGGNTGGGGEGGGGGAGGGTVLPDGGATDVPPVSTPVPETALTTSVHQLTGDLSVPQGSNLYTESLHATQPLVTSPDVGLAVGSGAHEVVADAFKDVFQAHGSTAIDPAVEAEAGNRILVTVNKVNDLLEGAKRLKMDPDVFLHRMYEARQLTVDLTVNALAKLKQIGEALKKG